MCSAYCHTHLFQKKQTKTVHSLKPTQAVAISYIAIGTSQPQALSEGSVCTLAPLWNLTPYSINKNCTIGWEALSQGREVGGESRERGKRRRGERGG